MEEKSSCSDEIKLEDIMSIEHRKISNKYLQYMIEGYHEIDTLRVPILKRDLTSGDKIGQLKVRIGIGRYSYEIPTGLYLLGDPEKANQIIVTCNYKLTIDYLRINIKSEGVYLLVLDTFGINVWCAAGKGTFGTKELIYQLTMWDIKKKLKIRRVILPQLGATSMEPHLVRKLTGISVVYGPVDGKDLDKFIQDGLMCDEDMRTVKFPLKDRLALTPIEFIQTLKYWFISFIAIYIAGFMFAKGGLGVYQSLKLSTVVLLSNLLGTVVFPVVLPILPFKSFAIKNILLNIPFIVMIFILGMIELGSVSAIFTVLLLMDVLLYIGFLGFRFTGSTTFTSFSGVKYEGRVLINCLKVVGVLNIILVAVNLLSGGINV